MERDADKTQPSNVEFFGVKLKVNNPHLAALLNSSVHEDVQVIGSRARDVLAADGRTETEDAQDGIDDEAEPVEVPPHEDEP